MSRMGKASLLLAVLFLIATAVARLVINQFHPSLYVPLALGVGFLVLGIIKDFRLYAEFFSMRTTKNGLAMGWLILLGLVVFACLNFLAVRYNKTWDLSSEGFNSLSDQSIKIAQTLKAEAKLVLLTRQGQGDPAAAAEVKRGLQELVRLYQSHTEKLSFETLNALTHPDIAKKYGFTFGEFGLFLDYNGKHLRVDQANEESITRALLKLSRDQKKVVYFLQGHGERPLEGESAEAISQFKKELETTYQVSALTLFNEGNKIPENAELVALVGPAQELLAPELQAIKEYLAAGGRILVAADPGEKHNAAQIMKLAGVEYQNDYILDPRAMVPGAGNVAALGSIYSQNSEITKGMGSNMSLFLLASALKPAPDLPSTIKVENIVSTNESAHVSNELTQQAKSKGQGPHVIAVEVQGKLADSADAKEFSAVFYGDSDVFSNQLFGKYGNRDLAMNTVAALVKDTDLISIRPKQPKGTAIGVQHMPAVRIQMLTLLSLPLILLISSGVIWFRRRAA